MLEVLGSSDIILPLLATAMSAPTCLSSSLAAQAEQSLAGSNPKARHRRAHAKPRQADLPSADGEPAQHSQQAVAAAVAQLGPHASDAGHDIGQLPAAPEEEDTALPPVAGQRSASPRPAAAQLSGQDTAALPSSEASAQAAPDQSPGQLDFAPETHSSDCLQDGLSQASSTSGQNTQSELPFWLQPMAPLPAVYQPPAATSQQAHSRRQRQEQQHESQHESQRESQRESKLESQHHLQAGLVLSTMRPSRLVGMPFQQAYGQVVAPLDHQQLPVPTQPPPQHADGPESVSNQRETTTRAVVAPVHAQHGEGSMVSAAQPLLASQTGASHQEEPDLDANGNQQEAQPEHESQEQAGIGHEYDQHAPLLSNQTATLAAQESAVLCPDQEQHAQHAQHAHQAWPLQHDGTVQHSALPDAQNGTHNLAAPTAAETIQSHCHSAVHNQSPDDEHAGTEQAAACCSGVAPGEPVVSSREHAQHHLRDAAPLPWQESGGGNSATLPER